MSPLRRWRHVAPEGYNNERPIVPHLLPPTFTVEVEFALETFVAQPFGKKRAGSSHHHALHCFSCLVVFSTLPIPTIGSLHACSSRPRCLFYLLRCPLYLPRTPNYVVMLHPTVHAQEAAVVSIERPPLGGGRRSQKHRGWQGSLSSCDGGSSLSARSMSASKNTTAEHMAEHTAEHIAERLAEHIAEHTAEHIAEHIAEHRAERIAEHTAEHIAEHTAEHTAEYIVERTPAEHTAERSAGHAAECAAGHIAERMAEHTAEHIAEHIAEHEAERIAAHTIEHAAECIAERIAACTVEHAAECMAECIAGRIAARTLSTQQSACQKARARTRGMSAVVAQGSGGRVPQSGQIFAAQHGPTLAWRVPSARAQSERTETSPRSSRLADGRTAERGCVGGPGCIGEPRGGVDHEDR